MPGQCPAANRATRSTCPRGNSSRVSVCGAREGPAAGASGARGWGHQTGRSGWARGPGKVSLQPGVAAAGSGSRRGRAGLQAAMRAEPGWTLGPPNGVCGGGGAGGRVWRGGGGSRGAEGEGEPEKLASAWVCARRSGLTKPQVRPGPGDRQGKGVAAGSGYPVSAPRQAGRRPRWF